MKEAATRKTWRWSTRIKLRLAGWRPGRNVWDHLSHPTSFTVFPEARRVLSEFGGLQFGDRMENVRLDPSLGAEAGEQIRRYERLLGARLYPLGVMDHQDRHYLLIDENGVIYKLIDQLEPLGSSFDQAIKYFVHGSANPSEVEHDLRKIGMLGKTWHE